MMTKNQIGRRSIKKAIGLAVMASMSYCFISIGQASEVKEHEKHTVEEGSELQLSHDLKVILNQEMREIEEGMMKIIPAISAGNWETIADIAKNIKDSFILKQKLTKQQIEELHHSLSAEFVEMDQNFHSTAGKLAHAAHQQDGELVNFYFYKLHSQCMTCHSKYASKRFSSFQKIQQDKSHHH
jgi:hypothetical protein